MTYARKLGSCIKSANLKTLCDFIENLWKSFAICCKTSQQMDIIFANYVAGSVEAWECKRRTESGETIVTNRTAIQQVFTKMVHSSRNYLNDIYVLTVTVINKNKRTR